MSRRHYVMWGLGVLLGLGLILLPHVIDRYTIYMFYLLWMNVGLAQSWNLLAGYAGLISLGTSAFFGIGAYTAAMMITHWEVPLLVGSLGGGLLAAGFAAAVAIPIFRFRGIYFAIGTLVLSEALRIWMINWRFTGRAEGIHLPPESGASLMWFYYVMLAAALGITILVALILRTKLGMGLRAIGNNEDSAQNMGVNTFWTKFYVFLINAFVTGLIGGIHAAKMGSIEPYSIFSPMWGLTTVNTVIIGGTGTVLGPVVGSIFIVLLSELLADYHTFHLAITGILLIVIIRYIPEGLWGEYCESRFGKRMLAMSDGTGKQDGEP